MFVTKNHQGKGIGKMLLGYLEKLALKQGFGKVIIDASIPGFGLYSKAGYGVKEYNKIETENGAVLCYHVMEKKLYNNDQYFINYNNRTFTAVSNTENGEVSDKTIFNYNSIEFC